MKYDFYLSYSTKDIEIAGMTHKKILEYGYSCFFTYKDLKPTDNYIDMVKDTIRQCKYFIVILSEASEKSLSVKNEINYAFNLANEMGREIYVIAIGEDRKISEMIYRYATNNIPVYTITEYYSITDAIKDLIASLDTDILKNEYQEKIQQYLKLKDYDRASQYVKQLVKIIANQILECKFKDKTHQLYNSFQNLFEMVNADFYIDTSITAHNLIDALADLKQVIVYGESKIDDIFIISICIKLKYLEFDICNECVYCLTNGDCHVGLDEYNNYQQRLYNLYCNYFDKHKISINELDNDEWEKDIIRNTSTYMLLPPTKEHEEVEEKKKDLSNDEQITLNAVASYFKECNSLFNILADKSEATDFIRCLLTSFERLRNYCELINEKEIGSLCIEKIVDIKKKIEKIESKNESEESIAEKGLKTLLGLKLADSGNYDVFISHKNEDSDLAELIYEFLHSNLKKVFFDKISLPQLSKSEYDDAILNAIDCSDHMIVVLSNIAYISDSTWVQREMKTFNLEIVERRKENANLIFVVTNEVMDEIKRTNKKCFPVAYRCYEIILMSEYKSKLLNYLN